MYKEEIITVKERAFALADRGFLFYRDSDGNPHKANSTQLQATWNYVDFFACSHPEPRTPKPFKVTLLVGANAYACIDDDGRKTDILLSPGKGAPASLREYAAEQRERAARLTAMADLAERAASELESRS